MGRGTIESASVKTLEADYNGTMGRSYAWFLLHFSLTMSRMHENQGLRGFVY